MKKDDTEVKNVMIIYFVVTKEVEASMKNKFKKNLAVKSNLFIKRR